MTTKNSTFLSTMSSVAGNHSMMMHISSISTNKLISNQHGVNGTTSLNSSYLRNETHQQNQLTLRKQKTCRAHKTIITQTQVNDSTLSFLMEKLYNKSSQMKSWNELTKSVKQSLLEKRPIVSDHNDRILLQRCLDTIQNKIEVKSVQSMVERLDTICRQLKLKFNFTKSYVCFVSSDMYYVEIQLNMETGHVLDCKVSYDEQEEAQSCPELISVLQKGNFIEFTKHLEGLSAIYQIDKDKNIKSKGYLALHALENDLGILSEVQKNNINGINNMIHKSPAGILESRKGGYPMKMTFFVAPYDLIDLDTKTTLSLTVDTILAKNIGYSATVCIEESLVMHKLQIKSLIGVKTSEGKNLPHVVAHSATNATQLPACFVLKLARPLPICIDQIRTISKITGIEFSHMNEESNLITLLANQFLSVKSLNENKSTFYASLPDQNHCYYVNSNSGDIKGILIEKVPFTHPSNVPRILMYLRQQVLFNVIMGSIIRQFHEIDSRCHIFEITATDLNNIYVQFEHPIEQSLATIDIDLKDITNVKCKLYPNKFANINLDDFASKIMQKSLSIPITMRSIINRTQETNNNFKEVQKKDVPSSSVSNQTLSNFAQQSDQNIGSNMLNTISNQSRDLSLSASGGPLTPDSQQNPSLSSNKHPSKFSQSLLFQSQNANQYSGKSCGTTAPQQQQAKTKNVASSSSGICSNTMLMNMLSDVPHAALEKNNKKRKRLSSTGEIPASNVRRRADELTKSEPSDFDHSTKKLNNPGEISSFSDNDIDNNNQGFYSIKSGDDGFNEQLKIIKSLEEMPQAASKETSTDLPKLILKNEKLANSIKVGKIQTAKIPDLNDPAIRKDRKRKRTDSLDNRDASYLDIAYPPTSTKPPTSVSSSSISNQAKMLTQSNFVSVTPPKLKKSNSISGSSSNSSGTITSPVSISPTTQSKNLQISSNMILKYSEKIASASNKGTKSNSLPMLSKISDFQTAAALAVAASSGGSQALAAAAAAAVLNNSDAKRMAKQVKAKIPSYSNNSAQSSASALSKTSPVSLSVASTTTSPGSSSACSRLKDFKMSQQQQSLINSANANAAAIKQKNLSSSTLSLPSSSSSSSSTATSASLSLSSPKHTQTSTSTQSIAHQGASSSSSTLAPSLLSVGGTLSNIQKNLQKSAVKKCSLTAVVDRLRQNAGSEGGPPPMANSPNVSVVGSQASTSPEMSRPDSSSCKLSSSSAMVGKSNTDKSKYSRNLDSQFTIKQSNSGLKMSITKTKSPASGQSTSTLSPTVDMVSKIGPAGTGLFKSSTTARYTIPKIPKTSHAATSSSGASLTTSSIGAITSPTLSSSTSLSSGVGSSSSLKKLSSNASKSAIQAGGNNNSAGKTPQTTPRMSPKSVQAKSNRQEKVFKNSDLLPPGPFTKLGPPLNSQMTSAMGGIRMSASGSLFKQSNLSFSDMSMAGTSSWPQASPTSSDIMSKSATILGGDLYLPSHDRLSSSVSSSSDLSGKSLPTSTSSTPSSPLESPSTSSDPLIIPIEDIESPSMVNESVKTKAPLIIPTESIESPVRSDSNEKPNEPVQANETNSDDNGSMVKASDFNIENEPSNQSATDEKSNDKSSTSIDYPN